ncbi:hypothetical protein FH972_012581 [Carpinus fangiana]|uniref:Uncharacterized protein n=1 Tax=Carpinus fangiana TaxID=176857 RepID=A0A5N6R459_9ROSI|nr:hypothetical protein FH972_012581 [Carpinus fangiana]
MSSNEATSGELICRCGVPACLKIAVGRKITNGGFAGADIMMDEKLSNEVKDLNAKLVVEATRYILGQLLWCI